MQTYNFLCVTTNKFSKNFTELIDSINKIEIDVDISKKTYIYSMNDGEKNHEIESNIFNPAFVGLSFARNELIKKIQNGYIILCDDDALYGREFLIKLNNEIKKQDIEICILLNY